MATFRLLTAKEDNLSATDSLKEKPVLLIESTRDCAFNLKERINKKIKR
jgi:hypothetical protein